MSGILAPKPVSSFAHFNFDDRLMRSIRKSGYSQPTPIQAQVSDNFDNFDNAHSMIV